MGNLPVLTSYHCLRLHRFTFNFAPTSWGIAGAKNLALHGQRHLEGVVYYIHQRQRGHVMPLVCYTVTPDCPGGGASLA